MGYVPPSPCMPHGQKKSMLSEVNIEVPRERRFSCSRLAWDFDGFRREPITIPIIIHLRRRPGYIGGWDDRVLFEGLRGPPACRRRGGRRRRGINKARGEWDGCGDGW